MAKDGTDARPLVRDEGGVFDLNRSAFTQQEIFDLEMERIFERGWLYLCHESQVENEGDYYSTQMGRQPVYVHRGKEGKINAFINACAHRGAVLTPQRRGNARTLTCRFHGWCFNTEGRCTKIKTEKVGWPDGVDKSKFSLQPIAKVQSYKGFIYGSLTDDCPSLEEHLGESKVFIDLLAEQSPEGMEVVRGGQTYLIRGNWKLQAENGVDGYHVSTVHRVFAGAMAKRESMAPAEGMAKTESGRIAGKVETGSYDIGMGHMLIWAKRSDLGAAPLSASLDQLRERFDEKTIDWMAGRGRNLFVYPNVHLMDQPSTQIRVLIPIAPDRTEARVYCIAPKGEPREARIARVRKFEDFYMVTGMATPDDMAALEDVQRGSMATNMPYSHVDRGRSVMVEGPDETAKELGLNPVSSNPNWENETLYYGFYRRWNEDLGGA
ncbi:Rieske 2Fe-2S domain-containing protein [Aquicoccus sp. SCR17]|nr:Rieske 2Fe-2S domain-containing protein [Carideicomes alvinocaridis]